MFTFGFSLLMARLSSSIPDIKGLMPFILRAGAYLSGVYFPLTIMSGDPTPLTRVLSLNPLVAYLTIVRDGLMGESIPASLWLLGGTAAVLMLLVGGYAFYRGEPKYGY
jgi:ABC-type polysaccharide/polyol phosphate export permease